MKSAILSVLALGVAAAAADGHDERVQTGPAPNWVASSDLMDVPADAAGLVFARRSDTFVHLDADGMQQYIGYRMKLLHPNALQLGNVSISWNPDAGPPVLHALKVHRGDQVIDLTNADDFEVLRREENLEAAQLDGVLTAVMRVPDLRVGDELEFAVTTRARNPVIASRDSGLLFLAPEPAAGRHALALSWEDGHEPTLRTTPELQAAQQRRGNSVRAQFDDPPSDALIQDAPLRYNWGRFIEFTDYPDWASVSSTFAPLYEAASQLSDTSPLKQEAALIAAQHSDEMARARAALELVQLQVRYIFVGMDGGNLIPATADETWDSRYGDCKGKTTLLLALLRELGIEAYPVLVNNSGLDDGLDERLPNPGLFDHVLVRARINGAKYWLDGTLPAVARPSMEPVLPYEWVLPLMIEGGALEHRPWRPASTPNEITLMEIDARAGFDQPARVTHTMIVRGIAGLASQIEMSAISPGRLLGVYQQNLTGNPWQTIDDAQWRYDVEAGASILTLVGTQIIDWDTYNISGRRMSLPGGGFRPPTRRVRPSEQGANVPFYNQPAFNCYVTTVRVPEATRAAHWSHNSTFDTRIFGRNYYRAFEARDGTIRMIRGSRVERDEISADVAQADNARIPDFDNSMAWIYYDPTGTRRPFRSGDTVPATYEIDWTAQNVPCVAPEGVD